MKKLILVGEMNDVMRSIYDSLISEFSVQLCDNRVENVEGIVKIFSPDIVVLGGVGSEDIEDSIFEFLSAKHRTMPVLIVANEDSSIKYEKYCVSRQYELLVRPTTNRELLKRCLRMLKLLDNDGDELGDTDKVIIKKKLLVVDDSPLMLRSLKNLLDENYTVFLASSGEQALQFIPKKKPDLVLLDYEMPGMNGKETFEAMIEDEFAKNIPVIFLTSISQKEQIFDVLQYRPADYVLKPPSKEDLIGRIENVLSKVAR